MATLSVRAIAASCGIFPPLSLKRDFFRHCGSGTLSYSLQKVLKFMQSQCSPPNLLVQVTPSDGTEATIALNSAVLSFQEHPLFTAQVKGRYRVLSYELVDPETLQVQRYRRPPASPEYYQVTVFDYVHNRTLLIEGHLDDSSIIRISESTINPLPNDEEFQEAIEILLRSPEFGEALRNGDLRPFRPMPPLLGEERRTGLVERTLGVGLAPTNKTNGRFQIEIVGVNMISSKIYRYEGGAPEMSLGIQHAHDLCDPPPADHPSTTPEGTPGAARIQIFNNGFLIWNFIAVRPAASSGTKRSGIELRFVEYLGRKVLHRAHVPILNVEYETGVGCGPYRDWQWQEGLFEANGTDVAPGFRLCPTPAKTIIDTEPPTDSGNFRGVAVYVDGTEVVLISEMEAGWYRYISEWRFNSDGTIKPRFRFATTADTCACEIHRHHAYWRFDWDINTSPNSVFRNINGQSQLVSIESAFNRDPNQPFSEQTWIVAAGNNPNAIGYQIVPGNGDRTADNFGVHDTWILRYHPDEIDDGVTVVYGDREQVKIQINKFLNNESVASTDIVTWYGSQFYHDEAGPMVPHIVGPDLRPQNWPWLC